MTIRRGMMTFVAWAGVLAAAAIPFVLALAKWQAGWSDVRWLPSHGNEVIISPNKCELYLLYEGDPTSFPSWWTERWGKRTHLGNETVFLEIYGAIGVPVHARQLRIHIDTWWLMLALVQPMLWRLAARQRRARAALIGCCANCGYDLRGSKGDCPECGRSKEDQHRSPQTRPVLAIMAGLSFAVFAGLCVQGFTGFDYDGGRIQALVEDSSFEWIYSTADRSRPSWDGERIIDVRLLGIGFRQTRFFTGIQWELEMPKTGLLTLTATLPVLWWMRAIRLRRERRFRHEPRP